VESVPATPHINGKPTSFTYRMKGVPTANASGNPIWSEYWRVRHLALERNIIELSSVGAALQISTGSVGTPYPRVYRRVVTRENIVRMYGDVPSSLAYAVGVAGCEKGVVQNNISALARTDGKILFDSGVDSLTYFNNQQVSGARVLGWSEKNQRPRDELSTRIEDSTLMAL
jgi:hypothetical protein